MSANENLSPIPLDITLRLCEEIRRETENNWYTASARWCWSCQQSTNRDPSKRGFLRQEGNRGCILINARYARLLARQNKP